MQRRGCARAARRRRRARCARAAAACGSCRRRARPRARAPRAAAVGAAARARRARGRPATTMLAHVGAGDDPRAGGLGAGDVGDAGVLLGGGRAAEHADARADAAARVAAQVAVRPAEPLGAAPRDRRVGAGQLGRDLGDRERALDALEAAVAARRSSSSRPNSRAQRSSTAAGVRKQVPELTSVVPPRPRPSGSRIGGDAERRSSARRRGRGGASISGGRAVKSSGSWRALLEHDHPRAALGQLGRRDGTAGARADHADIGVNAGRSAHERDPPVLQARAAGPASQGKPLTAAPQRRAARCRAATTLAASQPSARRGGMLFVALSGQ